MNRETASPILARDGGIPVRADLLPYGRHSIEEDDIAAVVAVLRSDHIASGPQVEAFEGDIAARVGARFAVAFSSGTAALHAAMRAAGVGPGDEAITTTLTFCATANAALYEGATPRFADVEPASLTLDPDAVASVVTPATKAIVPVDMAGQPSAMAELRKVATDAGAVLIEDACHALGARYQDRPVGSVADMTVFSFHPVKHVATGEGGMVTTDDEAMAASLRRFRNHGIDRDVRQRQADNAWLYEMVDLGYNYRLDDMSAALGRSQLRRLDANLGRRGAIADEYGRELVGIPGIVLPRVKPGDLHAWHIYPVRLEHPDAGLRDAFIGALRAENIGAALHYPAVHLHPYYRQRFGYKGGELPVAEAAIASMFTLPMFHAMTDQDVRDVITAMHKVAKVLLTDGGGA